MPQASSLVKAVLDHPAYRAVLAALAEKNAEVILSGLTRTAKTLVVAGLAVELRRPVVVLEHPATPQILSRLPGRVWMLSDNVDPRHWLPGCRVVDRKLVSMDRTKDANAPGTRVWFVYELQVPPR